MTTKKLQSMKALYFMGNIKIININVFKQDNRRKTNIVIN